MPRIVIQADHSDRCSVVVTLSERIISAHVQDCHYAAQLIERLSWATADAESLELLSPQRPRALRRAGSHRGRPPTGGVLGPGARDLAGDLEPSRAPAASSRLSRSNATLAM
jgi:hypothetical protein